MQQRNRLVIVLLLNLAMLVGLSVIGWTAHSLGVLAAAGDFVADSAALGLGLIAIYFRDRPQGNTKATSIVALINVLILLVVTLFVIINAVQRLTSSTPHIDALPVIIVSAVSAISMFMGAYILRGDVDKEDIHMRSILLDTIADAASATAVAVTGGIIFLSKGLYWLDSAVALLIAIIIGFQAVKLLRDVAKNLRANR